MSARQRSLCLLEAYFRRARRMGGLKLTPAQCERIADEIRADLIRLAPPAEDYPFPITRHDGAA